MASWLLSTESFDMSVYAAQCETTLVRHQLKFNI